MTPLGNIDPTRCMKCGFCMSVCPVYETDQVETHVARGRNMLIKMAANEPHMDKAYQTSLSYCLLCRRCESVCLAGLRPAEITIQARHRALEEAPPSLSQKWVHRALVNNRSGMAKIVGMASVLPGISNKNGKPLRHLVEAASLLSGNLSLPPGARPFHSEKIPRFTPHAAGSEFKGQVAIFPGCVFEFFMTDVARDMISALSRAGFEVHYPSGLSCCGQAVYSKGDFKSARLMAKRNIQVLAGFDQVVTGCATCGSALKSYGSWFEARDPMAQRGQNLAQRTMEFTELLDGAGYQPPASDRNGHTITYHDPCHMKWHLGISQSPRRLLQSIKGASYREMDRADACCGLGGAFGLTHRHIGQQLLDKKISTIKDTDAQTVVTACPGCLLNLKAGARRHGLPVQVMHISRLMAGPSNSTPTGKGPD